MAENEAYVEDFRTYYAICDDCRWEGREYEDDMYAAQREADEHECTAAEPGDEDTPDGVMPPPMFDIAVT